MMSGELSESNQVNFSNNCWNRINIGAELFIKNLFFKSRVLVNKRDECCCTEKLLLIYSLKTSNNISPGFLKLSSMERINHENLI